MKRGLSVIIVAAMLLFVMPAMADEFQWPKFLPAIINAEPPPITVTSAGQVWMDRNLGATRVATSPTDSEAYGDLYQWGRITDGHEKRTSLTISALSTTNVPGHGNYILAPSSPYDWRTPPNNNLWQGVSGTNNPCPSGFRLPTKTEWETERLSWSSNNSTGAFESPLKLVMSGLRVYYDGTFSDEGSAGYYWSSGINSSYARLFGFGRTYAQFFSSLRASGLNVRCIKN